MSGPAVHHIVAQNYLHKVLKSKYTDPTSAHFWNKIENDVLRPYYFLGAQGPDFLFFNMNDWPSGIKEVAKTYLDVMDFFEDLKNQVKNLIPEELWQAIDTLEGLAEDAVERSATLSEIEDLSIDVKNNINGIKVNIEAKIKDYVTDSVDLFSFFKHPQHDGQDFPEWWWFDTLHVRRTGRFLSELMKNSAHGSAERAYALGYLTHYSSDIVGHPFVNIVCGGPYRTHSQRHKVVENLQDTWAYSNYVGGEFITSNLAKHYLINNNERNLPESLSKFIIDCMQKVYFKGSNSLYGQNIKRQDLDLAYRTWLKWFTSTTNDTGLPLPQPYSITAEIAEAWNKFVTNAGDIGDYLGNAFSGGGGFYGFLKALAALILGPLLLAAALIDFIISEGLTLGAAPIRFFLSLCYQELYDSYQSLRQGVVMNGFAFPKTSDLSHQYLNHMLHSATNDSNNNNASSLPSANKYPSSEFQFFDIPERHLIYPIPYYAQAEPDRTKGAPAPYFNADASWYIDNPKNQFHSGLYEFYRKFVDSGLSGTTASSVNAKFSQLAQYAIKGGLGNANSFGEALYQEFLTNGKNTEFVDFSMDSDRGYAFKCWRKVWDMSLLNSKVNDYQKTNVKIAVDKKVPNVQTDIIYPEGGVL